MLCRSEFCEYPHGLGSLDLHWPRAGRLDIQVQPNLVQVHRATPERFGLAQEWGELR